MKKYVGQKKKEEEKGLLNRKLKKWSSQKLEPKKMKNRKRFARSKNSKKGSKWKLEREKSSLGWKLERAA